MAASRVSDDRIDNSGFAESLLDDDGNPLCDSPDACEVCVLYGPLTADLLARMREQGAEAGVLTERRRTRLRAQPPALLKPGQWSRKYDRCQGDDCRSPDARHYADGKCRNCYVRDGRHALRGTP